MAKIRSFLVILMVRTGMVEIGVNVTRKNVQSTESVFNQIGVGGCHRQRGSTEVQLRALSAVQLEAITGEFLRGKTPGKRQRAVCIIIKDLC